MLGWERMRLRPALFAALVLSAVSCWFVVRAQQPAPAPSSRISLQALSLDPADVAALAGQISQRSVRLQALFGEVQPTDWVAKGAPDVYVAQWNSLSEQNKSIQIDMAVLSQHPDMMPDVMKGLFRIHRFDSDLQGLIPAVRRYQNLEIADQIESVFAGDQRAVEKLQQYVLDLAGEKERLLELEDSEAQRCRSMLANQPIARPAPPKKTPGNSK